MASAKKLPSGNWRVQVFSHTDSNGKKVMMSFTASTKAEAEMKAAKFANNKDRSTSTGITFANCLEEYITVKTDALSPSTIRSYRNLQKKYYHELADKDINKITNKDVQNMLNNLKNSLWEDKQGNQKPLSMKSIKNIYALFTAAISFKNKEIVFNVELPKEDNPDNITIESFQAEKLPSNEEIKLLFKNALPWLQKCIALAAFSGMRRGEIAALRYKDILPDESKIFVHSAFTMDERNTWVIKPPKTYGSIRFVNVPKEIIDLLGTGDPEEFVIGYNPNTISKMFIKLRDNMGIDVTFHQLRHFYASIGNVLHVPDTVLADFGGWEHNSPVMKSTYQNNIKNISEGYAKKMNDYFSSNIIKDEEDDEKNRKRKAK